MSHEIAFEMAASNVRFGAGVTREVGMDLVDLGVRRALVVTDPNLTRLAPVQTALSALEAAGVEAVLYDRVRVEPTDVSFRDAIQFAESAQMDGIVAVGGGSVIDTAKAVNLYTTYPPADFLDYVNAPIGKAMPVPGPLKPLIAIPTTAGTGSETTGVSIFDLTALSAKTGIAQPPAQADAGPARSRQHANDAAGGGGVEWARHLEPRPRIVSRRCRIRRVRGPRVRRCVRRIRGRTRSATSGRCKRCAWSRSFSSGPSTIPATTKHASR